MIFYQIPGPLNLIAHCECSYPSRLFARTVNNEDIAKRTTSRTDEATTTTYVETNVKTNERKR